MCKCICFKLCVCVCVCMFSHSILESGLSRNKYGCSECRNSAGLELRVPFALSLSLSLSISIYIYIHTYI